MKNKEVKNKLHIDSQVRTLSLKFYDEQLPEGEEILKHRIMCLDKRLYQVVAIKHYKDSVKNDGDPFEIASVKPHWHLYLRVVSKTNKPRIGQLLKMLGIEYRKELDKDLWNQHGVETCEDYTRCVVYGLHKTKQAESDGKAEYDIKEYVSNMTIEEIKQIMDGYTRLESEATRPTSATLADMANVAWQLGYDLKDFDEWWDSLPFVLQSHAKMRTIKERYKRGIEARVKKDNKVNRLCVFIQGKGDQGKTYSSIQALKGKEVLVVGGSGTGKYDKLKPTTNAIIIDDDKAPNLLNMTDNYFCDAYRRNSNNPVWCGEYFIVTNNKSFEEWVEESGIKTTTYNSKIGAWVLSETYQALKSRFYICEIRQHKDGFNVLYCTAPSTRGTYEDQRQRFEKYEKFRSAYNESLRTYSNENKEFDYSNLNGGYREMTDEEVLEMKKDSSTFEDEEKVEEPKDTVCETIEEMFSV